MGTTLEQRPYFHEAHAIISSRLNVPTIIQFVIYSPDGERIATVEGDGAEWMADAMVDGLNFHAKEREDWKVNEVPAEVLY